MTEASGASGVSGQSGAVGETATDVAVPAPRRPASTRDRLIDTAIALTAEHGWSAVTMVRLAETAQVSRQTVYNDIGTRADLAEAMILRELERFLGCVTEAFEDSDDLRGAIRQASYAVLDRAQDNRLLHAIVSATHGADTELLPFLTSNSHGLLGFASAIVREHLDRFDHGLTPAEADTAVDAVVRVVLSHVMQPGGSPDAIADDIAWMAARVLHL